MIDLVRPTVVAGIAAAILLATSLVSDPIGIYAVVDRVVLEPDTIQPTRIQIWGVFAVATGEVKTESMHYPEFNSYEPAQRGYMYFSLDPSRERPTRAEWADLRRTAGNGEVTAFGRRFDGIGRVRRATEPPRAPDVYPVNAGLMRARMNARPGSHGVLHVPLPVSPADGGRATAGTVRLVARTLDDTDVFYMFELQGPGGARELSPPIRPTTRETSYTPDLDLRDGAEYTWRVWVTKDGWAAPAAIATFRAGR